MSKKFNKRDVSILIGNLLDHFDGALYGFLAPVIAPVFFPGYDKIVQLILVYSILATSLLTKPIGAIVFGLIAKKHNPIIAMSYSLAGVAVGTVLLGLVPGYDVIGWWASFLLIVIRFTKGIFAAGENAIVKLYIMENKEYQDAFRASYIYQGSSIIGIILASAVSALVLWSGQDYLWRICFMMGGSIGIIAYILRSYANDKILSKTNSESSTEGYEKTLSSLPKELYLNIYKSFAIAFSTGLSHITYSIPCVVMNSLIPFITDITIETMMGLNTLLLILDMILIFTIGPIIKKFNYLKIIIYSAICITITVPMLFAYLPGSGVWYVSFVRIWIVILGVIFMCPQNLFYKKLFEDSDNKYLIIGLSNAVGAATIGRLTPAFTLWLWYMTGGVGMISIYIGTIAFVTAFCVHKASVDRPGLVRL